MNVFDQREPSIAEWYDAHIEDIEDYRDEYLAEDTLSLTEELPEELAEVERDTDEDGNILATPKFLMPLYAKDTGEEVDQLDGSLDAVFDIGFQPAVGRPADDADEYFDPEEVG